MSKGSFPGHRDHLGDLDLVDQSHCQSHPGRYGQGRAALLWNEKHVFAPKAALPAKSFLKIISVNGCNEPKANVAPLNFDVVGWVELSTNRTDCR